MDGIFYSKDNIINNFEYWQKYDPFKRTYEDTFFKTCVKKGRTTYLQQVFPSKDFMENTELLESTELVVCKLRVQKILSDKTKTNKAKALEIIELLSSYPLSSILTDLEENFDKATVNTYLISEFVDEANCSGFIICAARGINCMIQVSNFLTIGFNISS